MMLINYMKYDFKAVCYYDTDSIMTTSELPEEVVDANVLGKMKLENKFTSGLLVASKCYYLKGG